MPDDDASNFTGFGSVSSHRGDTPSPHQHDRHRRRRRGRGRPPPSSIGGSGDVTKTKAALPFLVALALYALFAGEEYGGGTANDPGRTAVSPVDVVDGDPRRSAELQLAMDRTTASGVTQTGENSDDGSDRSKRGGWLSRRRAELFGPTAETTATKNGGGPEQPSYVALCRAALRLPRDANADADADASSASAEPWGRRTQDLDAVYEDASFCSDGGEPYDSVMTVLASGVVSEAFGLAYDHGCDASSTGTGGGEGRDASAEGHTTIQQVLPSEWSILRPAGSSDAVAASSTDAARLASVRDGLLAGCARTVRAWDAGGMEGAPSGPEEILLSEIKVDAAAVAAAPPTVEKVSRTVLSEALPGLAAALRAGRDRWRSIAPAAPGGGAAVSGNGNALVTTRQAQAVDRTQESAVIYLSCLDDACSSDDAENSSPAFMMPAYYYAHRISPSITSLSVLASTSCVSNVRGCRRHGEALAEELARLYPRAEVTFAVATSTADAYTQMLEAKYLACPPGVGCLLPALAREGYDSTLGAEVTIVDDPDAYPWFRALRDEYAPWVNLINRHDFPVQSVQDNGSRTDPVFFLRERPRPDVKMCRLLRGRSGRWVQDMEYAKAAQYETPLKRYRQMKFQPTDEMPYTSASTYRWEDDFCPMRLADRGGMCEVLEKMDVSRLMIVGDSLSLSFAKSLWKLLGHDDDPDPAKKTTQDWKPWMQYRWTRTVECGDAANDGGDGQSRSFTLQFVRNDLLNGETANIDSFSEWGKDANCGTYSYCFPWLDDYLSYSAPGRTLLVANLGSHLHSVPDFTAAFDSFAALLERHRKPTDAVLFRTTVPGHAGCQDPTVKPLPSHDDFQRTVPSDYKSWDLFSTYNDIAYRAIRERVGGRAFRGKEGSLLSGVDVLDVYPMTALRPDGHEGGAEGCARCKKEDCLHYTLPGPPDFWVHLMFSNLVDMAR